MNTKALKTALALLAAIMLCLPCSAENRGRTVRSGSSSSPEIDAVRFAEKISVLINNERLKKRLKPLPWDDALHSVAQDYSRDMFERRFFSHTDPDGKSFFDRYKNNGIVCKVKTGDTISLGGENIAQSSLYQSAGKNAGKISYHWFTEDELAASIVKRWMGSKGHRENILTPYFRKQGIGAFISPDMTVYVTQNFC